jgi:hypothetical protein
MRSERVKYQKYGDNSNRQHAATFAAPIIVEKCLFTISMVYSFGEFFHPHQYNKNNMFVSNCPNNIYIYIGSSKSKYRIHRVDRVPNFLCSRPDWGSPTPSRRWVCVGGGGRGVPFARVFIVPRTISHYLWHETVLRGGGDTHPQWTCTYISRVQQCLSPRRNWDSPTPSLTGECFHPLWFWGRDTLAFGRGGVPIPTRGQTLLCSRYPIQ